MNRATWIDRARGLLRQLSVGVSETARREAGLCHDRETRRQEIEDRYAGEHQALRRQIERDFTLTYQRLKSEAETETRQAQQMFEQASTAAAERARNNQQAVEECDAQKARLQIQMQGDLASAERSSAEARQRVEENHQREARRTEAGHAQSQDFAEVQENLRVLYQKHVSLCNRHGWRHPTQIEPLADRTRALTRARSRGDSLETATMLLEESQGAYAKLQSFVGVYRNTLLAAGGLCLSAVVLLFVAGKVGSLLAWVAVVVMAALAVGGLLLIILVRLWIDGWSGELNACRQEGERMLTRLLTASKADLERCLSEIRRREERELATVEQELEQKQAGLRQRYEEAVRRAEVDCERKQTAVNEPSGELHGCRLAEIAGRLDWVLQQAAKERDRRLAKADSDYAALNDEGGSVAGPSRENWAADSQARRQADLGRADADHREALDRLAADWNARLTQWRSESAGLFEEVRQDFPDWHSLEGRRWQPLEQCPEALPIGQFTIAVDFPGGGPGRQNCGCRPWSPFPTVARWSSPPRVRPGPRRDLPAGHCSAHPHRPAAGQGRFTFIDPVALGEPFAPFLHLIDHDERLVSGRVWTEPRQIEQQLEVLADHMTNVIQMYLRGQYQTIGEYNARAGEVAEPYRFLVVAGFPTGFSADALRRLQSIITAGPRCGINTLLLVDGSLAPPAGFDLEGLRRHAVGFDWRETPGGERFVWQEDDYSPWPLELEHPPDIEVFNRLLHEVGRRAGRGAESACPSRPSLRRRRPGGAPTAGASCACPWAGPGRFVSRSCAWVGASLSTY